MTSQFLSIPLAILTLAFAAITSQSAQFVYLSSSPAVQMTNAYVEYQEVPITTTATGPVLVNTSIGATGNNSKFRVLLDGTMIGEISFKAWGSTETSLLVGSAANVAPGSHMVTIEGQGSSTTFDYASTMVTLPAEPDLSLAVQMDQLADLLAQINASINSGNSATQAALEAQFATLNSTLSSGLSGLQAQLEAIETAIQNAGDGTTGGNTGNGSSTALSGQVSQLSGQLAELQQRLAQVESRPATSTTQTVKSSSKEKGGLDEEDYLIIGGSAAGATALGVGIYSLLDHDTNPEPKPDNGKARPGYKH
jgi:hypothetical protein